MKRITEYIKKKRDQRIEEKLIFIAQRQRDKNELINLFNDKVKLHIAPSLETRPYSDRILDLYSNTICTSSTYSILYNDLQYYKTDHNEFTLTAREAWSRTSVTFVIYPINLTNSNGDTFDYLFCRKNNHDCDRCYLRSRTLK